MTSPLRVLVIDDDRNDALLAVRALERGGYGVAWDRVDSAPALGAALERETWDLILCDWVMPQFDAPAALALLRERGVETPVIVVSGQVGEEYCVTALHQGARDFVSKDRLVRLVPAVQRELREVEERRALRLTEVQVRLQARLLDAIGQAVVATDLGDRVTYWNRAAELLFGWTAAEAIGRSAAEILPSITAAEAERESKRARGETWSGEVVAQRRDGNSFPALVAESPVADGDGTALGTIRVVSDVSERVRAVEALCEANARQSDILDALPAHVALLDGNGVIVAVNRVWQTFAMANAFRGADFGVGANYIEVCERSVGACSEEAQGVAAGIRAVLHHERESFALEYPCHSPEEERWFRVMVAPLGRDGAQGAVVMHLNVTQNVLIGRALQASQERARSARRGSDL